MYIITNLYPAAVNVFVFLKIIKDEPIKREKGKSGDIRLSIDL